MLFALIAPSFVACVFYLLWLLPLAPTVLCLDLPPLDVSSPCSSLLAIGPMLTYIGSWILVLFPWTLYYFPWSKEQSILLCSLCRNRGTCCTSCWLVARDSCLPCHLSSPSWIPSTFGTRPGTMVPQTTSPKPRATTSLSCCQEDSKHFWYMAVNRCASNNITNITATVSLSYCKD